MILENQVCTLEQAKKLKALGIEQRSFFTWYGGFEGSEVKPNVDLTDQHMYDVSINGYYGHPDNTYSAFNVAELGIMLSGVEYNSWTFVAGEDKYCVLDYKNVHYGTFNTEADARAELLINLIEARILNAPEVSSHSLKQ